MKYLNFVNIKQCSQCKDVFSINEFYANSNGVHNVSGECKKCRADYYKNRKHTLEGLTAKIYGSQLGRSRIKGWSRPDYSLYELRQWMICQLNYSDIHNKWVESDCQKMLTPSCDRLDDDKPYTLDNLRLVTWKENKAKGEYDRKHGINNSVSKQVKQLLNGEVINTYYSTMQAMRDTGIQQTNIAHCCRGKRPSAGGFKWEYVDQLINT